MGRGVVQRRGPGARRPAAPAGGPLRVPARHGRLLHPAQQPPCAGPPVLALRPVPGEDDQPPPRQPAPLPAAAADSRPHGRRRGAAARPPVAPRTRRPRRLRDRRPRLDGAGGPRRRSVGGRTAAARLPRDAPLLRPRLPPGLHALGAADRGDRWTAAAPVTRIVVFEDSVYRRDRDGVYTDRAFLLFAASLSGLMSEVTMLGRLDPEPGRSYYRLPGAVRFRGLPHYPSLASPRALVAILRSARTAWSALGAADVAWLMGPQPLALLMVLMARVRGTPTVLGVRQDLPRYARDRHPGRRWTHVAADAL